MTIAIGRFAAFFRGLWGHDPFPWQTRLAEHVLEQGWPDCIDLPTGSGKTACIDIAVFVLACQAGRRPMERTVGRRIFFTVNRRVIVDEAFDRARVLAQHLLDAEDGILREVAEALRSVGGDNINAPPLDVAQLRGGIYRDRAWARSITQPMVVCTTADQLGSRLLFRGYGVSPSMQPVHAALTACDSLVLLDEAHVTQAFCQTMRLLTGYRDARSKTDVPVPPMRFVQMTATPVEARNRFALNAEDLSNSILSRRINAAKPAQLELVKIRKNDNPAVALASRAFEASSDTCKAIGVIVNRVRTARDVADHLRAALARKRKAGDVHLIIGRMRPIDRDTLQSRLREVVGPDRPEVFAPDAPPVFIVATQCLEVGADYDFDALITECASIDALRQRFGRLNRKGRPIEATAAIIAASTSISGADPVYGDAIKQTWAWLTENGRNSIDFGIAAFEHLWNSVDDERRQTMLMPAADAAVLLPAHLDALCQTNPAPVPSPDVRFFIHGPDRDNAEVNVCWRADLGDDDERWPNMVRLLPPSSPECMTVPLWEVRRWMRRQEIRVDEPDADAPIAAGVGDEPNRHESTEPLRQVVVWRGAGECLVVASPAELRPGDTIIVRVEDGGWQQFGHLPFPPGTTADDAPGAHIDIAEQATRESRRRVVVRIHPAFPQSDKLRGLPDAEVRRMLVAAGVVPPAWNEAPVARLERHQYRLADECSDEVIVFKRLLDPPGLVMPATDEDDGEDSLSEGGGCVSLDRHTQHVCERTASALVRLGLAELQATLLAAARLHDLGKADVRFQAMLAGITPYEAMFRRTLQAKSDSTRRTLDERHAIRERAALPAGFRHEMLSVQIAADFGLGVLDGEAVERDLALHLIAAHHGHGRPFAPVVFDEVEDDELLSVEFGDLTIAGAHRRGWIPAHRLDSGVADRFWHLTRAHGWWGLAWLEAVLRLADQHASAAEQRLVESARLSGQPEGVVR